MGVASVFCNDLVSDRLDQSQRIDIGTVVEG